MIISNAFQPPHLTNRLLTASTATVSTRPPATGLRHFGGELSQFFSTSSGSFPLEPTSSMNSTGKRMLKQHDKMPTTFALCCQDAHAGRGEGGISLWRQRLMPP